MDRTARRPTVFVDLDNTLLECGAYYKAAATEFGRVVEAATGLPAAQAIAIASAIDLAAIQLPDAWGRSRFPRSYFQAAEAINALVGPLDADASLPWAAHAIAERVFWQDYTPFPGALEALHRLGADADIEWQIVLVTKGDYSVQERKIERHQVGAYVDAIEIVPTKDTAQLERLIARHGASRLTSYTIGDSKDDILPAIAVGMGSVLITGTEDTQWAYEDTVLTPTFTATTFAEAVDHFFVRGPAAMASGR